LRKPAIRIIDGPLLSTHEKGEKREHSFYADAGEEKRGGAH